MPRYFAICNADFVNIDKLRNFYMKTIFGIFFSVLCFFYASKRNLTTKIIFMYLIVCLGARGLSLRMILNACVRRLHPCLTSLAEDGRSKWRLGQDSNSQPSGYEPEVLSTAPPAPPLFGLTSINLHFLSRFLKCFFFFGGGRRGPNG